VQTAVMGRRKAQFEPPVLSVSDRRRNPRHRLSAPITIWLHDGSALAAMTLEISESGMSLCVNAKLAVGLRVGLDPVAGGRVAAIVRHNVGRVCGLEFLDASEDQVGKIRALCLMLPHFDGKGLGI
jgi:hypothetical protein